MLTFTEFLQAIAAEYNTTGEVDGENNTDLGKPDQPKTRWYANKKKCGLNGLPCSKYVAQMKKNMKESTALRPGMSDEEGNVYEPDYEPDLGEYIANRFSQEYGEPTNEITSETGFILPDGRCVIMGKYGGRAEDHRSAIPSMEAMTKWKWNPEIIKQYKQSTRGYALTELIKRSGVARIHASQDLLSVDSTKLTWKQQRAIVDFIKKHRPTTVSFDINNKETRFYKPTPMAIEEYFNSF